MCHKGHCLDEMSSLEASAPQRKLPHISAYSRPRCDKLNVRNEKVEVYVEGKQGMYIFDRILKPPLLRESLFCIGIGWKPKAESISNSLFYVIAASKHSTDLSYFARVFGIIRSSSYVLKLQLHKGTVLHNGHKLHSRTMELCHTAKPFFTLYIETI